MGDIKCNKYFGNAMETLISDPAKFQKCAVLENKDYNFMINEKKLVDDILDTLYEKVILK